MYRRLVLFVITCVPTYAACLPTVILTNNRRGDRNISLFFRRFQLEYQLDSAEDFLGLFYSFT